jgi:biotin transporter BioY
MIAAGAIGLLLIFVPGVMWLALWLGSLEAGIGGGLLPFLPKAAVELMLAVTIASGGHRLAAQRRERQKGDSNGV